MHDSMQYDPIQSHGHEPFKVKNLAVFKTSFSAVYNGGW